MKILVLLVFLPVFCHVSYGEDELNQAKVNSIKKETSSNIDQSLNKSEKKGEANPSYTDESLNKSEKEEEIQTEAEKTKSAQTSQKDSGVVSQKIKKVFIDFLEVLEKESMDSKEYAKAVQFLENSLYNQASFETLKILASTYENKKDFQNQIKVLNILSASYSSKAESFYLLGMAYKNLYLNEKENKEENKSKSIENLNKALKLNQKYVLAYEALINLLKAKKTDTDQEVHTKESLSVVMDMLKYLKKSKYYIDLCRAYYDNNFLKQSQKACKKSIKKNPDDPISPLILALSRENKKQTDKELLEIAENFKESFFVQYNTALYFMETNPRMAITYFDTAYILQPDNITLNKIMAKLLFDNKREERSYEHFLKACLLTDGKFLKQFKQAKSALRRTTLVDLILKFQKGIEQCFLSVKKKKRDKK